MRPIFLVSVLISLSLCQAGPTPKIAEKQQVTEESKVTGVKGEGKLAIDEAGSEKDRSKKSTTTFCVEIRPGAQQLVQAPCICGETQPHVHPESPQVHPKPQPRPEPVPEPLPEPQRPANLVKPEEPLRPQLPNQVIVQPLPDPQETFMLPACEETPMFVVPPSNQVYLVPEQELGPPPLLHLPSVPSASSSAALVHVQPAPTPVIHVPAPAPAPPATLIHLPSATSSTSHSPLCPQYSKPAAAYYTECTCRPKESSMMRSEGSWMDRSMDMQDPMVSTHHHRQKISTVPMMVYRSPMMPCGNRYVMSSRGADGRMRMNEERSGTVISLHTGSHPHSTRLYHDQRRPDFYPYGHSYGTYHPGFGGASASATGIYIDAHPKMYHDMRMMPQGYEMRMSTDGQLEKTEMRDRSARQGEETDMSRQLVPREAVGSDSIKDDLKVEIPAESAESAVRNARSEGSKEKNIEEKAAKKEKKSIKQEKSS